MVLYRFTILFVLALDLTLVPLQTHAQSAATSPTSDVSPTTGQEAAVKGETPPTAGGAVLTQDRKQEVYAFLSAGSFSYTLFLKFLSVEDLPLLYEILEDTECYKAWGNAASAIGILGPSKASYRVVTTYIRRPPQFREVAKFSELHRTQRINMLFSSISSARWLPFLDPKMGTRCLRKILKSDEAARRFLKDWDEREIPRGFGDISRAVMQLRAAAAQGLILYDAKAHRAEVLRQFDLMDQLVAEIPAPGEADVSEEEASENGHKAMLLSSLGRVLAIADYVEENGTQQYLSALGTLELEDDMRLRTGKIMEGTSLYE